MSMSNSNQQLKLHSPAGSEPAIFNWSNDEKRKDNNESFNALGEEIVQTVRLVFEDYPELYQDNLDLDRCNVRSFSHIKELTEKFNKIMDTYVKLNRGTESFCARLEQRATPKLFRHILTQIYSRAVTDPEKLREYEPFSPSVYGETSAELLDSILKYLDMKEDDVFLDLGSGVGNVVLQVAALANCKLVYGIEYESIPAGYAKSMGEEFGFWMRWYGKCYSDFLLEQGDFLDNPKIEERIREADIIFVNNYMFGSTVNHGLKMKFVNMKDGAKIVSSREFCPETFRLNERTKNDLGAVMNVAKPIEFLGKVSWSDRSVQYYLHTIDHRKLAEFYENLNNRRLKNQNSKSSGDESSSSSENAKRKRSSKLEENRPSSVDLFLERFRERLTNYYFYMKSNVYRQHIEQQIQTEQDLNRSLKTKVNTLEKTVQNLLDDAIRLLKLRTEELGMEKLDRPEQLLTFANDVSTKHKELRMKIAILEKEIGQYDLENEQIHSILSKFETNEQKALRKSSFDSTKTEFLLSSKSLEPVQVHSIVSSKSKLEEDFSANEDFLGQSPRKKRDFYGRTIEIEPKT